MPDQGMSLRYRVLLPAQFVLQHLALLPADSSQFAIHLVPIGRSRVSRLIVLIDCFFIARFAVLVVGYKVKGWTRAQGGAAFLRNAVMVHFREIVRVVVILVQQMILLGIQKIEELRARFRVLGLLTGRRIAAYRKGGIAQRRLRVSFAVR